MQPPIPLSGKLTRAGFRVKKSNSPPSVSDRVGCRWGLGLFAGGGERHATAQEDVCAF
jgi:hypothetical protein